MSNNTILAYFGFAHLPERQRAVSSWFHDVAWKIEENLPDGPEKTVALRKVLEAKDAAVRASLDLATLSGSTREPRLYDGGFREGETVIDRGQRDVLVVVTGQAPSPGLSDLVPVRPVSGGEARFRWAFPHELARIPDVAPDEPALPGGFRAGDLVRARPGGPLLRVTDEVSYTVRTRGRVPVRLDPNPDGLTTVWMHPVELDRVTITTR